VVVTTGAGTTTAGAGGELTVTITVFGGVLTVMELKTSVVTVMATAPGASLSQQTPLQ